MNYILSFDREGFAEDVDFEAAVLAALAYDRRPPDRPPAKEIGAFSITLGRTTASSSALDERPEEIVHEPILHFYNRNGREV